jgi:hypothetical protein
MSHGLLSGAAVPLSEKRQMAAKLPRMMSYRSANVGKLFGSFPGSGVQFVIQARVPREQVMNLNDCQTTRWIWMIARVATNELRPDQPLPVFYVNRSRFQSTGGFWRS